ncbi:unnamed protein product [Eruca vesicaria subsp. sativa]|uniref:Uncharacterized protein n=1 Tax=Eruca vesicaria subsp. sativa TaxID=29727 RepID=A0ABC8M0W4_ERUVS|nr:unnamed protein product [Eruca vesicaria subsp. sativa]
MKNSPRNKDDSQSSPPPSPSNIITITVNNPGQPYITTPETISVLRSSASTYRQVVRWLTGPPMDPNPTVQPAPDPRYPLPPLRPVPNMKHSSSSSSTIYQRRKFKNHPKINPVRSGLTERLSPSILNMQSLVLSSPDTTLVHGPFSRSGSITPSPSATESREYDPKRDSDVEEREIRERGFYLHPSPSSTPTDPKPQLLDLFPMTSTRASDSPASST